MYMKTFANLSIIVFAFLTLISCSKKEETVEQPDPYAITKKYFVKAKIDGEWRVHQTPYESWCQTSGVLCYSNTNGPDVNDLIDVTLDDEGIYYSAEAIMALKGKTFISRI